MEWMDLHELQQRLRMGLEKMFPGHYWIRAEIAALQTRTSGHCYMELSQSVNGSVTAKARAVVWRNRWGMLSAFFQEATGLQLKAGMEVLLRAQVNYSELYGLSLVVDDIDPQLTLGNAEQLRRQTIARLTEEGLMDTQKELGISPLPYSLAVISAPDAAGYGDFCRHLRENEFGFKFKVTLFEATMQGESAAASMMDALERIAEEAGTTKAQENLPKVNFDAVLIMRGGGSVLDLACFDDYMLCRTIAEFPLPVFTAIGHDRDHHVADMVAYDFAKTPTALADMFIDAFAAEDERITSIASRLRLALSGKIGVQEQKLLAIQLRIRSANMQKIEMQSGRLSAIETRIKGTALRKLEFHEMQLKLLESRIQGANPQKLLERGYCLISDSHGTAVRSAKSLKPGDKLRLHFADGKADVRVE